MSRETMFFDQHPEFLETSQTASSKRRLNLRHIMMIKKNSRLLKNARVIDIASHDGRWSYAALEAGAAHVTGIEGRDYLVKKSVETLTAKGVPPDQFDFIQADAHDALTQGVGQADVVLCLGFLYHTLRYAELFHGIRATGAKFIILDTRIQANEPKATVKIETNIVEEESSAVEDRFTHRGMAIVGTPSVPALEAMLRAYDFDLVAQADWASFLEKLNQANSLNSYAVGKRGTFVARRRS